MEEGEEGHGELGLEEVGDGGGECRLRSGILSHFISFFGLQLFDRMKSMPKVSRGALESSILLLEMCPRRRSAGDW